MTDRLTEQKIVVIVRETRLEELKIRFNTASQARFYVEQLGGDFEDYEREDSTYRQAVSTTLEILGALGRVQVVRRSFLTNFIFGPEDLVVTIGQDGLVANTLKYLTRQPLVGVNPDPERYDGLLLPFAVGDLGRIMPELFRGKRPTKSVTMAEVLLNNGQRLCAVNDLFIGPKSHGSARYTIRQGGRSERQSSSGIIVSTGLGSTGWLASLLTGANTIASALASGGPPALPPAEGRKNHRQKTSDASASPLRLPWDTDHLVFTVREPFPSRTTAATLVHGQITLRVPLVVESHMPERGVIFSDGIETDFIDFNSGATATVTISDRHGLLVV